MTCRLVGTEPLSEPVLNIVNSNLMNKFLWNLTPNSYIFFQEINLKMSSVKWQQLCLCLNVFRVNFSVSIGAIFPTLTTVPVCNQYGCPSAKLVAPLRSIQSRGYDVTCSCSNYSWRHSTTAMLIGSFIIPAKQPSVGQGQEPTVFVLYILSNPWHDDAIRWKHFPCYWPFVQGIHRSPVNSPHTGQWRGALVFSLISFWRNSWINYREADDLRRYRAPYDVIVMRIMDIGEFPVSTI